MQINDRISITRDWVVCSSCGELAAAEVRARRVRPCRHAAAREVRRILTLLEERHRRREPPTGEILLTIPSQNHKGDRPTLLRSAGIRRRG